MTLSFLIKWPGKHLRTGNLTAHPEVLGCRSRTSWASRCSIGQTKVGAAAMCMHWRQAPAKRCALCPSSVVLTSSKRPMVLLAVHCHVGACPETDKPKWGWIPYYKAQ